MRVHLINPSDVAFGTAVITPRWLYVLAAATPQSYGTPQIVDETLEPLDPSTVSPGDVVGIGIQNTLADLMARFPQVEHIKIYDGRGQPLGRSFRVKLWPTLAFLLDGKLLHRAVRPDEAEILTGLCALFP